MNNYIIYQFGLYFMLCKVINNKYKEIDKVDAIYLNYKDLKELDKTSEKVELFDCGKLRLRGIINQLIPVKANSIEILKSDSDEEMILYFEMRYKIK